MHYRFVLVFGLLLSGSASAGFFGYENYWDCVLEEMPGAQNDIAARAVMRKCNTEAPARVVERKRFKFLGMDFNECLVKNTKSIRSELGANQVRFACRYLYE